MNPAAPVPIAAAVILALSLILGSVGDVNAAQGSDPCVAVSGGTVSNATNLSITADGGTGIADASGGSGNLAVVADRGNRNRSGQDIASAGNAGVATASADGGAISIGNINSGGNVGNAISVGDTVCPAAAAPIKPAPIAAPKAPVEVVAVGADRGDRDGRGRRVRALPSTGAGTVEVDTSGSLVLALGALGLMALSLGYRYDWRLVRAGRR